MTRLTDLVRALDAPACAWIYDPARFRDRLDRLRGALPGHTVLYAMKACADPAILDTAAETADGIECASPGELAAALAAGPDRIALAGPAKTDALLRAAADVTLPITVHAESPTELERLAAADYGGLTALRVNRGTLLPGTHAMTGPTPFGIDPRDLPAAAHRARALGLDITGFHLHAVSNCLDATAYAHHVTDALTWARRTAERLDIDLRYVNVGGGLGADPRGPVIDIDALARHLTDLDTTGIELAFEPGRYLAAPAGWYATEVIDLKTNADRTFAVVRGGTHHFRLPAAWNYPHPFTVVHTDHWPHPWKRPRVTDTTVAVTGELCTPRDLLNSGQHVEALAVGDRLLFADAGAYGWEISHDRFLAHPRPQRVVVDEPCAT